MSDGERTDDAADEPRTGGLTRRRLLRSAGIAAAGSAALGPTVLGSDAARAKDGAAGAALGEVVSVGPGPVDVFLTLNGKKRSLKAPPRRTLLSALRDDLGLTGAKEVCDRGSCGACTVWLDGLPVYACCLLAVEASGRSVTTVEGLGTPEAPHAVQTAFAEFDALQCGFCTPGLVMSVAHAVDVHGKSLDRARLLPMISGNLCRCGTYPHVVQAALSAARRR